ncbi:MAG: hypothetical protein Q7S01_05755 [bacterium]|nr:hypothetical protein [bacterium]
MNKNLIIGVLLAAVILIGGYYLFTMNAPGSDTVETPMTTVNTSTDGNTNPIPSAPTASAPTVVTKADAVPSNSTAVVTGTVTPNGAATTYWYEYGVSTALGAKTASQTIGSGYQSIASPGYITGLRTGTLYYFRLSANNAYGTANGATFGFNTNSNPPPVGSVPTVKTLSASGITRTSATLAGNVTPNKSTTQYWFEYGKDGNLGFTTGLTSIGNGGAIISASAAIADIDPATTYYYRLNAQNQFGTVNGAILTFKTSGPAAAVSPVVTTQVASSISTRSATVRGTVNPSGSQTTYWFEYSTDSLLASASLKSTPHRSAGAGATTVSVSAGISGLTASTTYYYRTVAQNASGTVRGDNLTFTTN